MRYFPLLLLFFLSACGTGEKPCETATLILHNGVVWTADTLKPQAEAVAICQDRIIFTGSDEEVRRYAGAKTEWIDVKGAFVTPGLIEGHGHFNGLGKSLVNLNLLGTKSWAEVVTMVEIKVKDLKPGQWIEGRGWHQEKWNEEPGRTFNGYPYHDALTAVSPDNPVVLYHASGHGLMANAKAMSMAGISRESADPIGGRIVRDASGELTGVFEENAMALIDKPFDAWKDQRSEAEKIQAFERETALAAEACLRHGITSFQDAGSDFWSLQQYERIAIARKLPIRLWAMVAQPAPSDLPKLDDFPKIGLADQHLTVRAVKTYFDGALGSYGAWLLEPYADKPGFLGQNVTPVDTLRAIAAACERRGLQCCVHAIGDRANREVLDIMSGVPEISTRRWRIEHAQHMHPADIPRFAQLGVIASMQAIHCTSDAPFVVKRLGEQRAREGAYVWRSLIDSGARLANGTDTPVEDVDPRACLYASVTRKRPDSGLEFFPQQAMTREEALLSYTLWNAYAAFEEDSKGSLSAGKLADIAVWNANLLQCDPAELPKAEVLMTIVGGEIKYRKNR